MYVSPSQRLTLHKADSRESIPPRQFSSSAAPIMSVPAQAQCPSISRAELEIKIKREKSLLAEIEDTKDRLVALTFQLKDIRLEIAEDSRSRTPSLPHDIIDIFVEYIQPDRNPFQSLYFNPKADSERDLSRMMSLCLVSRSWLTPACHRLYKVVHLHAASAATIHSFSETILTTQEIRPFVQRLHVAVGRTDGSTEAVEQLWFTSIPLLLNCMPLATISPLVGACWVTMQNWRSLYGLYVAGTLKVSNYKTATLDREPALHHLWFANCSNVAIPPISPNTLHTLVLLGCYVNSSSLLLLVSSHSASPVRRQTVGRVHFGSSGTILPKLVSSAQNILFFSLQNRS
jgi:hypothetical protein